MFIVTAGLSFFDRREREAEGFAKGFCTRFLVRVTIFIAAYVCFLFLYFVNVAISKE